MPHIHVNDIDLDFMHQQIAGSEFHLIPNAGHVVVMEQPGAVNSIVIGFLTRQSR